ncbi:MAG: thioredoxin family protein [Gemmatimonadota bacterium]|nr:MAG: thioredoxin family protein [Gemmatimonadota bacterium]
MTIKNAVDLKKVWASASPYTEFVEGTEKNRSLWEGVYRLTPIPEWVLKLACDRGKGIRLLAIVEDWCGDASNTVPVLAKLGDMASCLEMRVIERDENPEVMDQYLTNGARSIPIVIVLNEDLEELGHWGPRPSELQHWVMDHKDAIPKDERYKYVRRWYAKDKGETTMREVLQLIA